MKQKKAFSIFFFFLQELEIITLDIKDAQGASKWVEEEKIENKL